MSINHTKYDRDDFDPNYPAVSDEHECHVEQQYRDTMWFTVSCLIAIGIGLAMLVCEYMGWTKYLV